MFSGIRPAKQAGGDDGLFGQRLAQALPVGGLYRPDADLDVVGPLAAALNLRFHDAVLNVNRKDLSAAGVGTPTAEPCADAELFDGLRPALGPPVGAKVAPTGRGPDAALHVDGTGIFAVVVSH